MSVYLGKACTFMRIVNKWAQNSTCIVNNTKANGIKDHHARFQKFYECNKHNMQIWKTRDVNMYIRHFMRKCVAIHFGEIMLMNTSRGLLKEKFNNQIV